MLNKIAITATASSQDMVHNTVRINMWDLPILTSQTLTDPRRHRRQVGMPVKTTILRHPLHKRRQIIIPHLQIILPVVANQMKI